MELKFTGRSLGPCKKVMEGQQDTAPNEPNRKNRTQVQEGVHTNQEARRQTLFDCSRNFDEFLHLQIDVVVALLKRIQMV